MFVSTAAVHEEQNDAVSNQGFAVSDVFASSPDQPVLHRGGSIFGGGEAVVRWKVYHPHSRILILADWFSYRGEGAEALGTDSLCLSDCAEGESKGDSVEQTRGTQQFY